MKKLLALVLALVMVMGLSVVGANAATYSDADSITYKEAVDVMSAVGVLGGTDGKFNPTEALTREQGAKIITYLLMGGNQKSADALAVSSAPFTDVAADRWSAGSIAYCKAAGILGGKGDGTFGPTEPLTGAAFAKMCLVALGYDANREGLVGGDWQLNVARLVNVADLANEVTAFGYNTTLTRQDAAQVAFNTLKATMQEYTGALTADTKGNLTAGRIAATNNAYEYRSNGFGAAAVAAANMQFCENYFPTLKCYTTTNDYNQNVDKWYIGVSRLDYVYADSKSATTVETDKKNGSWTSDIGSVTDAELYTMFDTSNGTAAGKNITVWENGVAAATTLNVVKGDKASKSLGDRFKGAKVEAVDTSTPKDGVPDQLEVTYGFLAKVTKVAAATSSKARTITMEVYNANSTPVTGVTFETEDFAKDDYVIVYPNANIATSSVWAAAGAFDIIEVKAAESVNGTLSAIGRANSGTEAGALTVGGTKYDVAVNALATLGVTAGTTVRGSLASYGLGDGYTLYLNNGFVIGAKGDDVAWKDYVYVVNVSADKTDALLGNYNDVTYVMQDGTFKTVKDIKANQATITAITANNWATVEEDEDDSGYYLFKNITGTTAALTLDGTSSVLRSKTPTIAAGVTANDKTVFIVRSGASTFKVFTGISNVGNWVDTAGGVNATYVVSGGYAKLVYADFKAATATNDTSTDTPIFLLELAGSTKIDGNTRYLYNAVKDGALTQVVGTKDDLMTTAYGVVQSQTGALVTYDTNSDDQLKSTTKTATDVSGTDTGAKFAAWSTLRTGTGDQTATDNIVIDYSAPTLKITQNSTAKSYTVKADAPVYYFNTTDETLEVVTASDIVGTLTANTTTTPISRAGSVWVQFNSATDHTVKAIWVATSAID